ncbi:MAG: radical SAM family heme chaperone HemW [Acidobacteria bacterium]|nr:radical SAM family heme chaperone HemW [Acidobacteriota bacterium]
MPRSLNSGLYVHIPFCASICNYCNFTRSLFDPDLKRRYVDALVAEIREAPVRWPAFLERPEPDTLYFGGGTPSLLEPEEIARLIEAGRMSLGLRGESEVTLEANPETISVGRLRRFRGAGVNRLSFGVQSFRNQELGRLGRLHDAERAREVVGWAREAGFDNVSLDLMMWLPQQSVSQWLESVDELIALHPDHASLYLLEVYPNAPLRDDMARAGWSQAPDEDAAAMYEEAMTRTEVAGLEQYEISNVARPGKRARHNMKYWRDGDWLAFGCGAHSTLDEARWKNVTSTLDYLARVEAGDSVIAERRTLRPHDRLAEALFMGLRLTDGVDLRALGERYAVDVWAAYGPRLERHLEAGLARKTGECLRLTRRGRLLANEVMAVFV